MLGVMGKPNIKERICRVGEMAQQIKVLTDKPENLSSTPEPGGGAGPVLAVIRLSILPHTSVPPMYIYVLYI